MATEKAALAQALILLQQERQDYLSDCEKILFVDFLSVELP
jgi:hypothetical protein